MRPRRISLVLLAVVMAVALLPLAALWPRGGAVEAGGVLGGGWSWGDDSSRQLGNGAPNDGNFANAPVQVGAVGSQLTNIISISGGTSHSLALRTNGVVLAWGSDSQGQLGDGAPNDGSTSNVPVSVSNLTNVVAIAAGGQHSLALRRDGTVWAWGNDGSRQLGNGAANDGASSNVPVQVVGVGGSGFLTNVIAIAAGGSHSLALRSDGTVVSWGDDFQGQLGNGVPNDGGNSNVPVAVTGLSDVTAIAAGGFHSLALKRDSTVVSWGYDFTGQLGNSSPFDGSFSDIPVQVSGLTNAIAVAAGRDHSLALKSDGTVVAWGYDQFGQLGNGPTTDGVFSNVPVSVTGLTNVSEIAAGTSHSMARRSDGSVVSWGRDNTGQLGNGATNDGSFSSTFVSVSTLTNVVAIAAGGTHGLAVRSATNMRAWGGNLYGQFANNGFSPEDCDPGPDVVPCANTPLPVTTLSNMVAIAAGELHSVGLTSDGAVWAWGDDSAGQLGNGLGAPNLCSVPTTPCALSPVPVSGLSNIVAVAAGDRHSVALRRDGTVWSWGSHVFFQLGNGSATAPDTCNGGPCATSPVQVSGLTGIVAIAAGGSHSLALRDNGTVYAWGNGTSGQLGNGASSSSHTPVVVTGLTNVIAIAVGGSHSLALKSDGTVVSWGSDSNFQLGNGAANNGGSSNVPVVVTGLSNVIAIAGGGNHSLALKDDGTVVAWGDDNSGQLGNGLPATDSDVFVPVSGLSSVVAIAAGANHSLALKSDGTVAAWGLATPALLGNGGSAPNDCDPGAPVVACAATPVSVSSLINIVAITAGSAHNLAISHPADTTSVNAAGATSTYGLASVTLAATVTNTTGSTPVSEGTVTFTVRDGANAVVGSPITSGTVSNGVVSVNFSLVGVPAASYSISVSYSGSTNFLSHTDLTPATLVVNKAFTGVAVNVASATYGNASVGLSATVTNTSNSANLSGGTVTFSVSGGVCSSAALPVSTSSSSAVVNFTCNLGSTGAGTYVITASYSGDGNFVPSSGMNNLTLNRANTTTTVGVSPPSAAFCGNSATLTATVIGATGAIVNEGTVSFTITGPGSLGPVNNVNVVNGTASTSLSLGTATAGSYSVSATYTPKAGVPNFNGSSSSGGGNGAFSITPLNTTTTADPATRVYGQTIPLHALVVTSPSSGCNVNAGNVTFSIKQGATIVGTVASIPVDSTGNANATYSTPLLAAGSYTIQASYGATTNFNASNNTAAPAALTINKASTSTTAANLTGAYGGSVTLTATVSNTSNTEFLTGGTVAFVVAQTPVTVCTPAAVAIPTNLSSAIVQATCNLGTVAPGTYSITATYSGDANFSGSDNTLAVGTLTINKATTDTAAASPSLTYGTNSVSLSATVTNQSNSAAFTGGTVQFTVSQGATTICNVTSGALVGANPRTANASCTLPTSPRPGVGDYRIDAVYSGDGNFSTSTDATPGTLTINKANTSTNAINATATYGDNSVTLSATVANTPNSADLTGGTVTFTVTGVCVSVVSGVVVGTDPTTVTATCPINGPPRAGGGTYSIAAAYSGDANFNNSTDASPGTLTIAPATSTTTAGNVSGPYGGSVQLSATVQSGTGVALTGGSVTFGVTQGPTTVCAPNVPITAGAATANVQATCNFGTAAPGDYTLTAVYSGDANVATSSATPGTATITKANTTITVSNVSVAFGTASATLNATVQNNSSGVNLTGGTVDFNIAGVCDPAPVAIPTSGSSAQVSASCTTGSAAIGAYSIEAVYSGDANFAGSTATPGSLTIGTANTTTTVDNVSVTYGSAEVQLHATVQSGTAGALTGGTVTLVVTDGCNSGALSLPTGATTGEVTFPCPLGSLGGGPHTITATYSGNGSFNGSNNTGTLTINKASTTTDTLGFSVTYGGGNVQLSATVSSGTGGPNLSGGTVNFVVGPVGTPVCTPSVAVPAGSNSQPVTATCVLGTTVPGNYAIVATYIGDGNFSNSASPPNGATLAIAKANTSLQVSNASITYAGGTVQLSATVTNTSNGANLLGGTVDFNVDGVCDPDPVAVPTTASSAQISASCPAGTVAPNNYAISASYSGDARFNSSVASGNLTINKRTPTVAVQDVTVGIEATEAQLTATLSSGSAGVNLSGGEFTFSVTFGVGNSCASDPLVVPNDVASQQQFTFVCQLTGAAPGPYIISGNYSGDANFFAASDTGTLDIHRPTVDLTVSMTSSSVHVEAPNVSQTINTITVIPITPGDVVNVTAQAQNGFTFVGWTWDGVEVGWANPVSLTMNANHQLVARFKETPIFPDVTSGQIYTTAVTELAARGLVRGYQDGNYGPNDRVQRAQMAALIARAMPAGPDTPPGGLLVPPACVVAGSWDCEDWGNTFFNPGGVPASLWRDVGTLAHYNVAAGYGDGTYGPFDDVTFAQTISFITRAMVAKGYWVHQPDEVIPYTNVPSIHLRDVKTFYHYTKGAFGGVPDGPTSGNGGFGDWNGSANRGWFARALWAAVNSYFGQDVSGLGGYIP